MRWNTPARWFEARVVADVLQLLGTSGVQGSFRGTVLFTRGPGTLYAGILTPTCSALLSMAVAAAICLGVVPGRLRDRLQLLAVTVATLFAVNVVRLTVVVFVGARWGLGAMAPVHEWVGTGITLVGWVLAVATAVRVAAWQRSRRLVVAQAAAAHEVG